MRCWSCKKTKLEEDFSWNNKSLGKRNNTCKECQKEYKRKHREQNRKFILNYLLEHPCVDCGEDDILVLQFDHVDKNNKRGEVAVAMTWTPKLLKEEITKCEIRCANCHMRRTAKQMGWKHRIRLSKNQK